MHILNYIFWHMESYEGWYCHHQVSGDGKKNTQKSPSNLKVRLSCSNLLTLSSYHLFSEASFDLIDLYIWHIISRNGRNLLLLLLSRFSRVRLCVTPSMESPSTWEKRESGVNEEEEWE